MLESKTWRRTITDHVKFVPYGLSVNDDEARIQYMSDMKGYCKAVLLPCFDLYEEVHGSLPKHLSEVGSPSSPLPSLQTCKSNVYLTSKRV